MLKASFTLLFRHAIDEQMVFWKYLDNSKIKFYRLFMCVFQQLFLTLKLYKHVYCVLVPFNIVDFAGFVRQMWWIDVRIKWPDSKVVYMKCTLVTVYLTFCLHCTDFYTQTLKLYRMFICALDCVFLRTFCNLFLCLKLHILYYFIKQYYFCSLI